MEKSEVCAIVTRGEDGFTVVHRNGESRDYKVQKSENVRKTAGAGDTFTGAFCSMLLKGEPLAVCLSYASVASKMTVESEGKHSAISEKLSFDALSQQLTASRSQWL